MAINKPRRTFWICLVAGFGLSFGLVWSMRWSVASAGRDSDLLAWSEKEARFTRYNSKLKDGLAHKFSFKNASSRTIQIVRAVASCSCASFRLSRYEVPPEASGDLTAHFDTSRSAKNRAATILVEYGDGSLTELKLSSDFVNDAKFLPWSFSFDGPRIELDIYKSFPDAKPGVVVEFVQHGSLAQREIEQAWKAVGDPEGIRFHGKVSILVPELENGPLEMTFKFSDGQVEKRTARRRD